MYWGGDRIKRVICIGIFLSLLLLGCSKNGLITGNPDFQGSFYLEEENVSFVIVDMNMTQEDIVSFNYPDEWEGYVVKWNDATIFLDETGTKISEEKFRQHDHQIKIWTKEKFKKQLTEFNRNIENLEDIYPTYIAKQIQLIEMKLEDYLERHVSLIDGKLAVRVFLGEEIGNDEKVLHDFQKELNDIFSDHQSKIYSYGFNIGDGNMRDVHFLEIEQYPAFVIFDQEQIVFKTYDQGEFIDFLENY